VEMAVNGNVICRDTAAPYSCPWTPTGTNPRQEERNVGEAAGTVKTVLETVYTSGAATPATRDVTPPTGTITWPVNGATVTPNVLITMEVLASDNVGVTRVEMAVNGNVICRDTAAPYSCPWTPTGTNPIQLQANIFDAAGNVKTALATVYPK